MHFVMSYSGGKDSALALWRLKCQGHQPVALLATYNPEQERSWFHGIPLAILEETAAAMSLPLLPCPCPPADYNASFGRALARAKALGAEACAFGDIDIPDHRQWDEERCAAAGLSCLLPLWGEGRAALAREGVEAGLRAVIKLVRLDCLDVSFLGRTLDEATLAAIAATGVDICGENGEYHTLVTGGPLFRHPLPVRPGPVIHFGTHAAMDFLLP